MFEVKAISKSEADIMLYGEIGFWDSVTARIVANQVKDLKSKGFQKINMRIHSPGGSVYEGLALYGMIRNLHNVEITAIIEGLSASMMSIVILAADKRIVAKSARIMLHQPSGGKRGTAQDMKNAAEHLESLTKQMASIYAEHTGKTEEFVMNNWLINGKDVWFTANEALEAGLVDEIMQDKKKVHGVAGSYLEAITAKYDSIFVTKPKNKSKMDRQKIETSLRSLGADFSKDATDEELVMSLTKKTQEVQAELEKIEGQSKEIGLKSLNDLIATKQIPTKQAKQYLELVDAIGVEKVTSLIETFETPKDLQIEVAKAQAQAQKPEDGGENGGDKANWSFQDYQDKDPDALLKMQDEESDKFDALAEGYLKGAFAM